MVPSTAEGRRSIKQLPPPQPATELLPKLQPTRHPLLQGLGLGVSAASNPVFSSPAGHAAMHAFAIYGCRLRALTNLPEEQQR